MRNKTHEPQSNGEPLVANAPKGADRPSLNSISLPLRDWLLINNAIQGLNALRVVLPFTISFRFGVLQRRLVPDLEQFEAHRMKILDKLDLTNKTNLSLAETTQLRDELNPLLDEVVTHSFTRINPSDLEELKVSPDVAGALKDLLISDEE